MSPIITGLHRRAAIRPGPAVTGQSGYIRPGGENSMSGGEVLSERDGDIATVTLNAPERLNALSLPMWKALQAAITKLDQDDSVRCIVLRGAGDKAFAAGADIAEFETERFDVKSARAYGHEMHSVLGALTNCRHPMVAMIKGACVGGGLEIASVCDMRICGTSSRFGVPVKNLGLVVAYNEMRGLVNLAGPAVALEIVLEGRIFGAEEAKEKGLVNRIVADDDVEEETYATAKRIAAGAPMVARWHKKFIYRLMNPQPITSEEDDESYACFGTEDFQIGYRAFLNKEKPQFKGR
jgi:enoyl-CoA hydratase/carnithine racemase